MEQKIATVFGATGFIGRHLVKTLADSGYIVRAVTRHVQKAYFLRTCGDVGQIVPMQASMNDPAGVDACVRGADAVIYLPGVLHARRKQDFERVHVLYPAQVAEACTRFHVSRFVHMSALACDRGQSCYAQTKNSGEQAVLAKYPNATILRPSLVFGPEDGFFGLFAKLARILPALPLIGGGHTKFQPVFVGDVVAAIMAAINLPPIGSNNPQGRIYEVGGPSVYSFKDLMQKIFAQTGRRRLLVPIPFPVAMIDGAVLQFFPRPLLTLDQVRTLKTDNIVNSNALGLNDLGIEATALESVLPAILARFQAGGPAAKQQKAA